MEKAPWHWLDFQTVPLFKPEDTPWEYRMRVGQDILIPGSPVVYPELGMDFSPHSPISLVPICSAQTTQLYALALYVRYIDGCSEQGSHYSRSIFGKNNLSTLSHMN